MTKVTREEVIAAFARYQNEHSEDLTTTLSIFINWLAVELGVVASYFRRRYTELSSELLDGIYTRCRVEK